MNSIIWNWNIWHADQVIVLKFCVMTLYISEEQLVYNWTASMKLFTVLDPGINCNNIKFYEANFENKDVATDSISTSLEVMKRTVSCKHREAIKNIQCEKNLLKSHLHSSKLGKRVEKHATSTNQKMAASMESLLIRLLL